MNRKDFIIKKLTKDLLGKVMSIETLADYIEDNCFCDNCECNYPNPPWEDS